MSEHQIDPEPYLSRGREVPRDPVVRFALARLQAAYPDVLVDQVDPPHRQVDWRCTFPRKMFEQQIGNCLGVRNAIEEDAFGLEVVWRSGRVRYVAYIYEDGNWRDLDEMEIDICLHEGLERIHARALELVFSIPDPEPG